MRIEEIMATIIEAIPSGQVFDENDVIGHLLEKYPEDYLKFCANYAHARHSMELAAAAVACEIEKFEGIFVEKQRMDEDAGPGRQRSVACEYTQWKRVNRYRPD